MASIVKYENGYRVHIKIKEHRESKTFRTKREAQEWAAFRETEIRNQKKLLPGEIHTLRDAFRKYANEMTKGKSNPRWEQLRVANLESQNLPMDLPICEINTNHISTFRDHRLKTVSAGTVLRDLSLLSSIFEVARIDWCWIINNPVKDIRKPPSPKHRDRVLTIWEIKAMLRSLKYNYKKRPQAAIHSIAHCFLLALRTGMRAGELCSLTWDNVHENYAYLPMTKNGKPRVVPLSKKAKKIIDKMKGWDDELIFGLKKQTLDTMFRRYRDYAGLSGFTWHDTRHTAATMLSKKLNVLDLCKMFGWTDPRMAMIYYNPHASTIADLLNA